MTAAPMTAVSELISILDLAPLEGNRFQGRSPDVGWQRIFGGLVVSQALVAAMRTVRDEFHVHSLHAYFILPGDPALPIDYDTENLRDGRSFVTRRVVAYQKGAAIFALSASFHIKEAGYDHQFPMPDMPHPDTLLSDKEIVERFRDKLPERVRNYFKRNRPIELKPVSLARYIGADRQGLDANPVSSGSSPKEYCWFRAAGPLPDQASLHRAFLAYASDMLLLDTALLTHGTSVFENKVMPASLDHAMWFHRPFRADGWLLYVLDSPSASGALGLARGLMYDLSGQLVASVAQEGLLRPIHPLKNAQ